MVVSNFRAALAVAQHQWPRSPVRSKATRHGLLRDAQDGLGQSRVAPRNQPGSDLPPGEFAASRLSGERPSETCCGGTR